MAQRVKTEEPIPGETQATLRDDLRHGDMVRVENFELLHQFEKLLVGLILVLRPGM